MHITFGQAWLPDTQPVTSSIDSQHRFYTALFMPYGVALVWVGRQVVSRVAVLNVVLAGLFVGGLARLISLAATGWPHPLFVALGVAELVVPPAVYLMAKRVHRLSVGTT